MTDRTQRSVLLFEQIDDATVHGVERRDRLAKIRGTARVDRDGFVAAAESFGSAREIAQRPRQSERDEHRRGQHEQVKEQRCERELRRDERRLFGDAQPRVQPAAVLELNRKEHRLKWPPVHARTLLRRVRVDRGPNVAHLDAAGLERLPQALLRVVAALEIGRDRGLAAELIMRAAARGVAEDEGFELGRCLGKVFRRRCEARDRRRIDFGAVELLPLDQHESEAGKLREQQRDTDQHRHLADEAFREQSLHRCRTSAASV